MIRRIPVIAVLVLSLAGVSLADFIYFDFSSISGLNLVGTATQSGIQIQLTQSLTQQLGAIYRVDREPVAGGFDITFTFQFSGNGADGFALIIQNESPIALQTNAGSTLGYGTATVACGYPLPTDGITSSLAVEFDTWDSGPCYGEPGTARHIAVQSQGTLPNTVAWPDRLDGVANPPDFENAIPHTARLLYDPSAPVLRIFLDDLTTSLFDLPVDIGALLATPDAWVGFTGTTGGVVQTISLLDWSYSSAVPLSNDDCVGAIEIADGESYAFDTAAATPDGVSPGCGSGAPVDLWYRFVPPSAGNYRVSLCGSGFDTRVAVYDGSGGCALGASLACSDDSCGTQSDVTFAATAGSTYYFQVGGAGGATGAGTVTLEFLPLDVTGAHLVIDGDTGGVIDSTIALFDALTAAGKNPVLVDASTITAGVPSAVWFVGGTFPANTPLTVAALGDRLTAHILAGADAYVSGGDIWGFDGPTVFFTVDGIDDALTVDGGDNHDGAAGVAGGPLDGYASLYAQDQTGNDWTDELVVSAIDSLGPTSSAVLRDDGTGGGGVGGQLFDVLTFYDTTGGAGKVACGSTEFGGYADGATILAAIDTFFGGGGVPPTNFRRGDCNDDAGFNIADPVYLLSVLFPSGPPPTPACADACEANDDGTLNIADPIAMLGELFPAGPPAPLPLPGSSTCGSDPTADAIDCAASVCP